MKPQHDTSMHNHRKYKAAIVILSVFLLLALAYIVYTYTTMKDRSPQSTTSGSGSSSVAKSNEKQTEAPQTKEVCATNEKLCMKYPSNWNVEAEDIVLHPTGVQSSESYHADKITFTHPSGLKLAFASGLTALGGVCTENDNKLSVDIVRKEATSLKGYRAFVPAEYATYVDDSIFAVAMVIPNDDETEFTPDIGLSNSSKLINSSQANRCDIRGTGIVVAKNVNMSSKTSGNSDHGSLFLGTKELGGYTASFQNKSYKTREEARRAFEGDDYKQAFEIARSVYYK